MRRIAASIAVGTALFLMGSPARAGVIVCNDFQAPIHVAFADGNFTAAGWWTVAPNDCKPAEFPVLGTMLYYAADSDSYRDGRDTKHDHWGNKIKLFVTARKFNLENVDRPSRGADLTMFSTYQIPEEFLGRPTEITFRFVHGSTTVNIKTTQ
jgi:uncharacterized membrane protein